MNSILNLIYIVVAGGVAFSSMVFLFKGRGFLDIEKKEKEAKELINKSEMEAKEVLNNAKEQTQKFQKSLKESEKRRIERLEKRGESMNYKEESLAKKEGRVKDIKLQIASQEEEMQSVQNSIVRLKKDQIDALAKKSGQSAKDLKENLLDKQQRELELTNEEKIQKIEEDLKENAMKRAKNIIIPVIQRLTSPTSVESRGIHVKVPRDSIKGKIVGKNGQNIIYFEDQLGVSVVFNDMPSTISISCFNLVQRRIAQAAMEKLVKVKKEINKPEIDKCIKEAEKEVNAELYKLGKKAVDRMGLKDVHEEFLPIIGRLKYRTSYGQNIMKHSMEVGWVAQMLGAEIGLDEKVCLVAGFLHDVGKAIDQDPNEKDAHDYITKELMDKYGFSHEETHAAWTHHDAIPQESAEALIIKAADAVSASRPGARAESIFNYSERIESLEKVTKSFAGVGKVLIMSGGREIRAMVDPKRVKDNKLQIAADKIAGKIEEEVTYPGKVKVSVVRRLECTETTKKNRAKK